MKSNYYRILEQDDRATDSLEHFHAHFESLIGLPFETWKDEADVIDSEDDGYTVAFEREEIRVWCDAGDQTWKVEVMMDYDINWIGRLSVLQGNVGYTEGELNPIAIFGLIGETGEIMNELTVSGGDGYGDLIRRGNVFSGDVADRFKKQIRDKKLHYDVEVAIDTTEEAFDEEMADQLYYFNAVAINRGKPLWYYAMISYWKVMKKKQVYIGQ